MLFFPNRSKAPAQEVNVRGASYGRGGEVLVDFLLRVGDRGLGIVVGQLLSCCTVGAYMPT